jgi:3-isopropylmalate/(R)-2-methylmalate dehydratase small subunit
MDKVSVVEGIGVPLRRSNVDTDQIIPANFLKRVTKTGYDDALFYQWRQDPDFILNQDPYVQGRVLVAGPDVGTGSSREHAVWALTEYGFRAVIAPGFADIFYNNSLKNGLLPVALPEEQVAMLWYLVEEQPDTAIAIDLAAQTVTLPDGQQASFAIDPYRKTCLLHGLDDLGYLLSKEPAIAAFEQGQAGDA